MASVHSRRVCKPHGQQCLSMYLIGGVLLLCLMVHGLYESEVQELHFTKNGLTSDGQPQMVHMQGPRPHWESIHCKMTTEWTCFVPVHPTIKLAQYKVFLPHCDEIRPYDVCPDLAHIQYATTFVEKNEFVPRVTREVAENVTVSVYPTPSPRYTSYYIIALIIVFTIILYFGFRIILKRGRGDGVGIARRTGQV